MCFRNKNTILNPNKLSNSKILKAKYRRRKKKLANGKKICWFVLCGWIEGESMSAVFYSLKSIVWPRKQIKQHTSTWNIDKWLNNLLFSRNKNVIGGNNLFFGSCFVWCCSKVSNEKANQRTQSETHTNFRLFDFSRVYHACLTIPLAIETTENKTEKRINSSSSCRSSSEKQ